MKLYIFFRICFILSDLLFSFEIGDIRTPTPNQKRNAWAMIALDSDDQLRQRMAWALSQIVVITPNQIADIGLSEIYLNFYDIFVRHAFGNYFDILKEVVSFSLTWTPSSMNAFFFFSF